ncbi:MAG TPA: hemolysin family protein [Anaerolineales bacterium]|nr:hemolysin family protein [Anaerolineales bacterium]
MTSFLVLCAIIAVLIILNGLFVAAEFAIVAVPRTRMAQLAEDGVGAAQRTLKILLEPVLQNRYIATAQVGITLVSLALGAYGEHELSEWILLAFDGSEFWAGPLAHTLAAAMAVAILTYLHVVVGEMIPKTLALEESEETALALAKPMAVFEVLFFPPVVILNKIGDWIVRLMGIPPLDRKDRLFTSEELEYIVEESLEGGKIDSSEQLFIENIFDLPDRTVEQVMTPRMQVIGIPSHADADRIHRRICETRKSRYPVYDANFDNIIGLLHIKDFARYRVQANGEPFDIRKILRPVAFVPDNLVLDRMLMRFQKENIQLAVVIDEYGGTAGVVSLEDLVEEVVGEIQDEFDREILPIEDLGAGVLRVRGDLILDELDQHFEIDFDGTEAFTVGGLVMELLGRIPQPKDRVSFNQVVFEVEATDKLAVQSVIVRLPETGGGKDTKQ